MAIIEQIKTEIERQLNDKKEIGDLGGVWALQDVLSFISTLESEKPMNQDGLEKAVVDYFDGYWPGMETAEQCNTDLRFTPPAIMRFARHFAQWGAEHKQKDEQFPPLEGLDAIKAKYYDDGFKNGFDEGVEEGKRLMMEEAVKWLIDDDYDELTDKGKFILGGVGIGYNGYYIPYSDLLKLPKEDEQ